MQADVTATFTAPTSNTITYTLAGQSHTATLTSGVETSINDRNNAEAACSATLTFDPFYNEATTPASSVHAFIISALGAAAMAYGILQ